MQNKFDVFLLQRPIQTHLITVNKYWFKFEKVSCKNDDKWQDWHNEGIVNVFQVERNDQRS